MKSPRLEKDFQREVLGKLRKIPKSYWIKLNDRVTIGLPDIIGIANGVPFAIELKTQTNLSKIQQYTLRRLSEVGVVCFVCYPVNLKPMLDRITLIASQGPFGMVAGNQVLP